MPKSFKKKKNKDKNAAGSKFRTPSNIKAGNFRGPKKNQSFDRKPVNIVRHKG